MTISNWLVCHGSWLVRGVKSCFSCWRISVQRTFRWREERLKVSYRLVKQSLADPRRSRETCLFSFQFLSFLCSFQQKFCQIIDWHTPCGVVPSLGNPGSGAESMVISFTQNWKLRNEYSTIVSPMLYSSHNALFCQTCIRVFHKCTRLAILPLLPTLYSYIIAVFFFIYTNWC